ncbi:MAG: hypothetical protein H6Q61_528 [Firmicutes bacterium]|nr:hypothetical protein [Bacillota bacterium]
MNQSTSQFILVTPPNHIQAASSYRLPLAHMAYRIGNGPHLYRAQFPAMPKGGLMMIGEDNFDGQGDVTVFCREVIRECQARGFTGILFDPESAPSPALSKIISILSEQITRRGWSFYLSEAYSNYSDNARILVSSAISGGSLHQRLSAAADRYGAQRVTLCIDRSAEDFFLPASRGSGRPLSREELQQKIKAISPSIFFSHELCAHYFTYMNRDNGAHFVLFDDVGSIRKKIALAEQAGIRRFLLFYHRVDDLLPELFGTSNP